MVFSLERSGRLVGTKTFLLSSKTDFMVSNYGPKSKQVNDQKGNDNLSMSENRQQKTQQQQQQQ